MAPNEVELLQGLLLARGITLPVPGLWRIIRPRKKPCLGEHGRNDAKRLEWFWLMLGLLLLLAAGIDTPLMKTLGRIFIESNA
jgi:hypothetical protein